jgi:hypothetical protein
MYFWGRFTRRGRVRREGVGRKDEWKTGKGGTRTTHNDDTTCHTQTHATFLFGTQLQTELALDNAAGISSV